MEDKEPAIKGWKAPLGRPTKRGTSTQLQPRLNVVTFVVMIFDWDPAKDAVNFEKHGIRFSEACLIFDGPVLTSADQRHDYGEDREISIGAIDGILAVVVVDTARNGRTRLISARLANRKERKLYHAHLGRKA